MINLHERMLLTLVGVEPATSWSPVGHASNWATKAGRLSVEARYPSYFENDDDDDELGPVVQSIISLTSSLVVKMLTVEF